MLMVLGLLGLAALGYAAFRLGRDSTLNDRRTQLIAVFGLVAVTALGVLAALIVSVAWFLLGRGVRARGGRRAVLVLGGGGLLALPLFLIWVFYMASLQA